MWVSCVVASFVVSHPLVFSPTRPPWNGLVATTTPVGCVNCTIRKTDDNDDKTVVQCSIQRRRGS